ncbi:rab GTPase-binding effector protein 2 isoform X1 [Pleurodeles waltl]|uniref:rab GTPase-binding effector protein 2 isoform X1 n=1 Tax=Pleurodeles waltl TaxID=8319 RepID=UPI003709873C
MDSTGDEGKPDDPGSDAVAWEANARCLQAQLEAAMDEIENIKAVATISESTKQEAIDDVKRQCQEEVASMQAIMKESISTYESRIHLLEQEQTQHHQYRELKEHELFQLKKHHGPPLPRDTLEKQMEKAHEDAEKLRDIVLPMEKEIMELKLKLKRAEEQIYNFKDAKDPCVAASSKIARPQDPEPHVPDAFQKRTPQIIDIEESSEPVSEGDSSSDEPDLSVGAEAFARNCDNVSIGSFTMSSTLQRKKLSPEQEETASLVSTGTLVPECIYIPPTGYQLVSEQDWNHMQQEMKITQGTLHFTSERLNRVTLEKEALEEALSKSTEDCARQVMVLLDQIQHSEKLLQNLQVTVMQTQDKTQQQLAELASSHKRLCYEVKSLSDENEKLRGRRKVPPEEEEAPLPSSVPELQKLVQRYRQENFTLQRGSDHQEERLRIEIVRLRDQLQTESQVKSNLQEIMQNQQDAHCEESASLSSVKTEMERLQEARKEIDERLQEAEAEVHKLQVTLTEKERLLQEEKDAVVLLQNSLKEEKNKLHRLQTELDTSEQVQQDFVRLSQTLQILPRFATVPECAVWSPFRCVRVGSGKGPNPQPEPG